MQNLTSKRICAAKINTRLLGTVPNFLILPMCQLLFLLVIYNYNNNMASTMFDQSVSSPQWNLLFLQHQPFFLFSTNEIVVWVIFCPFDHHLGNTISKILDLLGTLWIQDSYETWYGQMLPLNLHLNVSYFYKKTSFSTGRRRLLLHIASKDYQIALILSTGIPKNLFD